MIAYLKGTLQDVSGQTAIVLVGGVGYEVFISPQLAAEITPGIEAEFYIAENIKEDHFTLFGFKTMSERNIYFQLISVTGVGPKAAMSILSTHDPVEIESAIAAGKIELFSAVSGVGKKTAQRIILELKGKLVQVPTETVSNSDPAFQALTSLGYQSVQAKDMLENITRDLPLDERVKLALKGVKR